MPAVDPLEFLFGLEWLGMKFGLENIATLCEALGHPERTFLSVLVAGTNGKGSVVVMVETALRAAGHRTGRYTSPHLLRLEERFVLDGREIEPEALRASVGAVQTAVTSLIERGRLEQPPTFFECATAAAFELFRRARVDIAVLEVGLGGRLDATNIVTPLVTAITSIDFDHQAQLGNSLEAIAREKAGIIKAGIPVVCGPLPPEAAVVIRDIAAITRAPLIDAREHAQLTPLDQDGTIEVRTARRALAGVSLALKGRHQRDNAAVAVAILDQLSLRAIAVPDEAVRIGLTKAEWPGRLERVKRGSLDILLDAAHNPAGARALASHLEDIKWSGVTLVFAAMRDKDVRSMLETLAPFARTIVCATAPSARALEAAEIAAIAASLGPAVEAIEEPAAALARAVTLGRPVVIAGSIFLIGPLRDIVR